MHNLKCVVCGDDFEAKHKNTKYCSDTCRKIKRENIPLEHLRICINCGKKFINSNGRIKFCDEQCRSIHKYNYKPNINLNKIICINCNKEFEKSNPNSKFCSDKCKLEYNKKIIIYNCKKCGKEFIKGDGIKKRFCSEECRFNYLAHTLICKHCGKEFKSLNKEYFCSIICRKEHYRKLQNIRKGKDEKRSIYDYNFVPEGERKLYDLLTYIFYDCELIYRERYYWLTNPDSGYPLELDVYIPSLNLAFEHDGGQHKKFSTYIHKTKDKFEAMQRGDIFKNKKCKELGITLIRFDDIVNNIDITTLKYKLLDSKRSDIVDNYFVGLY